jgi:hypothetical protein
MLHDRGRPAFTKRSHSAVPRNAGRNQSYEWPSHKDTKEKNPTAEKPEVAEKRTKFMTIAKAKTSVTREDACRRESGLNITIFRTTVF